MRLAYELVLADNCIVPTPKAFTDWLERAKSSLRATGTGRPDYALCLWQGLVGALPRRRFSPTWDEKRFDKLVQAAHAYVSEKLGSAVRQDQTKHHAVKFFGPADQIWVYIDKKTRYLGELSEIVCGMPERIWRGRIYADESIRKAVKSFCEKWLKHNPSTGGVTDVAGKS